VIDLQGLLLSGGGVGRGNLFSFKAKKRIQLIDYIDTSY
jgi:hypothetical protein